MTSKIFSSLIKKIEQGCGFGADEEGYYECGKDIGDNGEINYCDGCSAQLSLLKTLQKEVEEVLEREKRCLCGNIDCDECRVAYSMLKELKKSLENVGVKQ